MQVLVEILRCKFCQSGFSTDSWALNAAKYWEIKSGFCGAKTFRKSKLWMSKQLDIFENKKLSLVKIFELKFLNNMFGIYELLFTSKIYLPWKIYTMVYEFGWCSQNMHRARGMTYGLLPQYMICTIQNSKYKIQNIHNTKYARGPRYELWFASTIYELRYHSPPLSRIDIENFASNKYKYMHCSVIWAKICEIYEISD